MRLCTALVILAAAIGCSDHGSVDSSPPLPASISRIAFGSCAFQWKEQPIWKSVIAGKPDLFLFLGDAIYGDFDGTGVVPVTAESLRTEWDKLAAKPEFQELRRNVPILATWDNHDYGKHDGGAEFELKKVSRELFLDFFGEPADSDRRRREGVYDAKVFGPAGRRVQLILLDARCFRDPCVPAERDPKARGSLGKYRPSSDPSATLLGEAQWRWLEHQLKVPAEVRFIVSGTQFVADQKGMEEWGNFPHERKRLFRLIETTRASGVMLLSGNVHFAEISRVESGDYPLVDFTSSGLTHVDKSYAEVSNPYRVAGPFAEINFGVVEIDWEARPAPRILLRGLGAGGQVGFEFAVGLDDLRSG